MSKPEEKARQRIDQLLQAAGWYVQDVCAFNPGAGQGQAVREYPTNAGPADYVLFVDRKPVGVIEAKPEGNTLSGVAEQSGKYVAGIKPLPGIESRLPFAYESTGVETFFRDGRDPEPRSRRLFAFHQPQTLKAWVSQTDTLRTRLLHFPPLNGEGLWDCQFEAVTNLERSFCEDKPRALIQMATGSGKTFVAVSQIYRLIKFGGAHRVLFLVDRSNLGRQTLREFQSYVTPDDGRKFTELYNVQRLTNNTIDPVCKVTITTIQRLYSMLRGEELDAEIEEQSLWDNPPEGGAPLEVAYNPKIPIETFDFIFTDECHRSIYNLWRQVLEYFDAYLIGLTATPSKQTLGFFNQNLVTEYSHARAVADGVNVGFDVYRIRTQISEQGGQVEAGYYVDRRDKRTRQVRWEQLDDDLVYNNRQLDREVVSTSQIRTILQTLRDYFFTDLFPDRKEVPKTLIFAKDDSHAEDIVQIAREVFGRGNEFCKKITYRTTGDKAEDLIASFRNSYNPRIAVTVDMISTGTDIKPLECLVFMRDVKSSVYFEQMKGRGTRTIAPDELQAVTPGTRAKTHFIIVDAVGVCESDKTDSKPLERKRSVPFDKLLLQVALGVRDEDTLSSLAGRLAQLDRVSEPEDCRAVEAASGGISLRALANGLLNAIDPDAQQAQAQEMSGAAVPTPEQVEQAAAELVNIACAPFDNPALRNTLIEIKGRNEQIIDTLSQDQVISAEFDAAAREKAQLTVTTFKQFIDEHKDELTALQILYNQPFKVKRLTYAAIKDLAAAIQKPPYNLSQEAVWRAYEQLERSKVRKAGPQKLLTNLVSLIRFALEQTDVLEPFPLTVAERYRRWLVEQMNAGRQFTPEQVEWLNRIQEHIAANLTIEKDDFDLTPFYEMGGISKVYRLFGDELGSILNELNEALVG